MSENQSYLPGSKEPAKNTAQNIEILKGCDEDYEWYPTTDKMIQAIADDINSAAGGYFSINTLLDVGAGDGRVLKSPILRLRGHSFNLQGIEKSAEQVCRWNRDITFVGGDFFENTLTNKSAEVIFCNPPYGSFELWAEKVILESYAAVNYLILPKRWQNSERIKSALKARDFIATVILEDDFLTADRRARAQVEVLRVVAAERMDKEAMIESLDSMSRYEEEGIRTGKYQFSLHHFKSQDAMSDQFSKVFPNLASITEEQGYNYEKMESRMKEVFHASNTLVDMVDFYVKDQEQIFDNYKKLDALDTNLFRELKIDIETIKKTLKARLKELRLTYWNAFVEHYKPINSRLTAKYRKLLYKEVINEHKDIDFTVSNALIVTSIVLEAANEYNNAQVTDFFYDISATENIKKYKSNQKVFEDGNWRYNSGSKANDRYTLDYRIIKQSIYYLDADYHTGQLEAREVLDVINDICIVAKIVGMSGYITPGIGPYQRSVGYSEKIITSINKGDKSTELLMIKFYKNGNQHLSLSKEFMLRLNIYIGKLLGWVTNAADAFDEMQESEFKQDDFNEIWDETQVENIGNGDIKAIGFFEAT